MEMGKCAWEDSLGKVHLRESTPRNVHPRRYTQKRESALGKVHLARYTLESTHTERTTRKVHPRRYTRVEMGRCTWEGTPRKVHLRESTPRKVHPRRYTLKWESALGKVHLGRYTHGKVHLGKCTQEGTPRRLGKAEKSPP